MKSLAITSKGLEDTACIEIKEILGVDSQKKEQCAAFEVKSYEEICSLCYTCQSIDRVLLLLHSFESKNIIQDIEKEIKKIDFSKWLNGKTAKVECQRTGTHDFTSIQIEEKTASFFPESSKIDFKNPDVFVFVLIVDSCCYIGIDFSGFELNKRPYKIFLHSNSIRGTIAYSLVRSSGFEKNETLLDPFSKDGMIAIEAAMFACKMPVNYYKKEKFAFLKLNIDVDFEKMFARIDKKTSRKGTKIFCYDAAFKNIDSCKKNAKIAGIEKELNFSRTELDLLDIKFEEKSVDRIVTNPILMKGPMLDKAYHDFFYQAEYILKDKGTVCVVTTLPETIIKHSLKFKFKIDFQKEVFTGEQKLIMICFSKDISEANKKLKDKEIKELKKEQEIKEKKKPKINKSKSK